MPNFGSDTPFMLIIRLKVRERKVAEYLDLADKTDKAVEASKPGMLHHTFDQDPQEPLGFVWSEFFKKDDASLAHLVNTPVGDYLEVHAGIIDEYIAIEFYGTVGDKVIEAMNGGGLPFKVFKSKLGYGWV